MSERKAVQRFSRTPQVLSGEQLLSSIGSASLSTDPSLSPSNQDSIEVVAEQNDEISSKSEILRKSLRSGHELAVDLDGEEVLITNKHGDTELTIQLTEDGPVVECKGTRLKLSSTQSIDMLCEDFRVQAEGDIHLNANRQLTIESTEELHLNCEVDIRLRGKCIGLN